MAPGLLSTIRWTFVITVAVIGGALSRSAQAETPSWYICTADYSIQVNPGAKMIVGKMGVINQLDYIVFGAPFQGAAGDRETSDSVQTASQRYDAEADAWAHSLHPGALRYGSACDGPFTRTDFDSQMALWAQDKDEYTSSQNWVPSSAAADFRASSVRASGSSSAGNKPPGVAGSNAATPTSSSGQSHRQYDNGLNTCVALGGDSQSVWFDNRCKAALTIMELQKGYSPPGELDCAPHSRCTFGLSGVGYTRKEDFTIAVCPKGDFVEGYDGKQWKGKGPFSCQRPVS